MVDWQPVIKLESFTPEMKETFGWVLFCVRGDWNTDTKEEVECCCWVSTIGNWRTSDRRAPTFVPTHFAIIGKLP